MTKSNGMMALLVAASMVAMSAMSETVTFKDGSHVVSSGGRINILNYRGTDDGTLIQNYANNNYGGRKEILIGGTGNGEQRAGVIRFDVSSLEGIYQSIDSMKLRFWVYRTAADNSYAVNLLREGNALWGEGTQNGSAQTGGACWNYANYSSDQWVGGKSGARLATDVYGRMGTLSLNSGTPVDTMVEVDLDPANLAAEVNTLTEVVDLWLTANAGFQIYGGNGQWGVDSSESDVVSQRPELVVTYTPKDDDFAYISFQQDADVLSSDGEIRISGYAGTEDASLVQASNLNLNYGGRPSIIVGVAGAYAARNGLIRFDVSSLVRRFEQVEWVKLRLCVSRTDEDATVNIHRMHEDKGDWVEGDRNGTSYPNPGVGGGCCWSRCRFTDKLWNSYGAEAAGSDYYSDVLASASVTSATTPVGTWVEFDLKPTSTTLTDMLKSWTGSIENPGLLIKRGGGGDWEFHSSETGTSGAEPTLLIGYTSVMRGTMFLTK